jgi:ATP-binding cassette subfamily B protein
LHGGLPRNPTNIPLRFLTEAPTTVKARQGDVRRIGRYLLPTWRLSLPILSCIAVSSLAGLLPPIVARAIIDEAIPSQNTAMLNWLVLAMIGAPIVSGLLGIVQNHLSTVLGQDIVLTLRNDLYTTLLRQPLRFFTDTKSGEIVSRLQNDVTGVQSVVSVTLVGLSTNALVFVTTLVMIFQLDWRLSLIPVATLPVFILPTRRVGRMRRTLSEHKQASLSELVSHVQETLSVSGYMLIRLFGAHKYEAQRYREKTVVLRSLQITQSSLGRWFVMFLTLFTTIGPALVYLVGGHAAIAHRLTVGTIMAFVFYLGRLYGPALALANIHVEIMSALALFQRIFQYLDLPIEVPEPAAPTRIVAARGGIRFDGVSMGYREGTLALKDITFEARPGQMIALVGPSGAGKTTLTYLACRLYDPDLGKVLFDGVDLRALSRDDLSRLVAHVTQESILFNATVEQNLRYGNHNATAEDIERACQQAQIHDTIARLPEAYKTLVGERGYKLSAGERQRLALARVILRDPKFLILDEATSSLDSVSEALVQQALERLFCGRTTLVVAHRLSTIRRADEIMVMDGGRIVERGTHSELVLRSGPYWRLYQQQFGQKSSMA